MAVELFEEHSAILDAAEAFLAAIKQVPPLPLDQLSRMRVRLSSLIRQHNATEEEYIFGPLMREGGLSRMPHLEPVVRDLMNEKTRYSEHIRQWTPQAIKADWNGYVRSVEERVAVLRQIIEAEETILYQAVLNPGVRLEPALAERRRA